MARQKLKNEDLVLNIIVNGNKAQSEIGKVGRAIQDAQSKVKALEAEQKKLERQGLTNTKRYQQLNNEIQQHNAIIAKSKQRLAELNQSLRLEDQSIKQLSTSLRRLKALRDQTVPDSKQWREYNQQINAITDRLNVLRSQGQRTAGVLTQMGSGIKNFFSSALGGLATMTAVITGVRKATDEFSKFDDQIADVMKTTNWRLMKNWKSSTPAPAKKIYSASLG